MFSFSSNYDFGLMRMERPVNFSTMAHIKPICLPETDTSDTFAGQLATVTGWGTLYSNGPTSPQLQVMYF